MVSRKSVRLARRAASGSKCAQSQPAQPACGPSTRSGERLPHGGEASPPELLLHLINNCRDELARQRAIHESDAVLRPDDALPRRRELLDPDDSLSLPARPRPHAHRRESLGSSRRSRITRRVNARDVFSRVTASMRSPAPARRRATSASTVPMFRLRHRLGDLARQAAVERGRANPRSLRASFRRSRAARGTAATETSGAARSAPPRRHRLEAVRRRARSAAAASTVPPHRQAPRSLAAGRLRTSFPRLEHRVAAVGEGVDAADGRTLLAPREGFVDPGLDGFERHSEGPPFAQQGEVPGREKKRRAPAAHEGRLGRGVVRPILLGFAHR